MRSQRFLISTIILFLSISSVVSAENKSFDGFYTSILLGYSNGRVNDGDLKYTAHCPLYGCGIFDFDIEVYDNFNKINNEEVEDLIVDLVDRLKPAHSNALVVFPRDPCPINNSSIIDLTPNPSIETNIDIVEKFEKSFKNE